jgi:hypothetical protein
VEQGSGEVVQRIRWLRRGIRWDCSDGYIHIDASSVLSKGRFV